jgi:hypothetical protein
VVLSVDRVKMRRKMFPWENTNYYSQKSAYLWHGLMLPPLIVFFNSITLLCMGAFVHSGIR